MNEVSVCVIGAGAAGIITAHTLIQDGFRNLQVLTRDETVGGVWSKERVYPGLNINNVRGEFQFSPLRMETSANDNVRLTGQDMAAYMHHFAEKYLWGHIRFGTEVMNICRENGSWVVLVKNRRDSSEERLVFNKVVLCTGGCSAPQMPDFLSPAKARELGFKGPVFHSSSCANHFDELLATRNEESSHVVVIGGGKSAQDAASYLANSGMKVSVVFKKTDAFLAYKISLPDFIRRSRFLSVLAGHINLRTNLERFLHTTWLGGKITRFIWNALAESSYSAMSVPKDSPLRTCNPLFWSIRVNDEGVPRSNSFFSLVNDGKIEVVAPAMATGYRSDGSGDAVRVTLSNGSELKATAVILATGYTSSWKDVFDAQTAEDLGIERHQPNPSGMNDRFERHYTSFYDPPPAHSQADQWSSSIYRGIVPAKNLLRRDFAINGAVFTTNNGYVYETMAHWISSYFLGDKMKLPPSPEAAREDADRESRFTKTRHPDMLLWANESYSSGIKFWTWPQYTDELLEDMGLQSGRSGGNWLTWPFKVISLNEIATLAAERRAKRKATCAVSRLGLQDR
ncbi:hypothetical protein PM082_000837 [Marasmius tenuissimus]|nr:hypothetical protein PM082_000837 [Marasmius tenuissimus]